MFWRGIREPTYRLRWQERFSCKLPLAPALRPVWIHAVSVGETVAATPIVEHFRNRFPAIPILITTTTPTGAATVKSRFGDSVMHAFFPYDLPWIVKRYMNHFNPRLLILMETELWPNLLNRCRLADTPVLIANARLSQKSALRYRRFASITKAMVSAIDYIAVQGADDGKRFISLGAEKSAVITTGSLKFDIELPPSIVESGYAVRRFLGVNRAVFMAGSTRNGEEGIVLEAFAELRKRHCDLLLLISPRHPERFEAVAEQCRGQGFRVARHSRGEPCPLEVAIYLIDSMGELPIFYAASDVAFVGGSMVKRGGHNVLEPAALGVPVVVGPHTYNFSDIVQKLESVGALKVAHNAGSLAMCLDRWLESGDVRDSAGAAGRQMIADNRGAAGKIAKIIDKIMSDSAIPNGPDETIAT